MRAKIETRFYFERDAAREIDESRIVAIIRSTSKILGLDTFARTAEELVAIAALTSIHGFTPEQFAAFLAVSRRAVDSRFDRHREAKNDEERVANLRVLEELKTSIDALSVLSRTIYDLMISAPVTLAPEVRFDREPRKERV